MKATPALLEDTAVVQRIFDHIDHQTTDVGEGSWREPVENYRSEARFAAERDRVLRRVPSAFCPSAALAEPGSYVAREAAGAAIVAVRGRDGGVRAFRNACRHRGTPVAEGSGCTKAFVCRYHGWTYDLDGALRHVPHERGFPGLDKNARGLVPVACDERSGVVFVTQDEPATADALRDLPPLIPQHFRVLGARETEVPVNWKIVVEGFLEGYHIRTTHSNTFYPVQFDNLNVVESFGLNNRIAFPYRAIDRMRAVAPESRSADGVLTYVYHLFPNAMIATFPGRIVMAVLEPIAVDRTRFCNFLLSDSADADGNAQSTFERGGNLIDAGAAEDTEVACAIQRSLASGANHYFEFGAFEAAIGRFHRALHAAIDEERPA